MEASISGSNCERASSLKQIHIPVTGFYRHLGDAFIGWADLSKGAAAAKSLQSCPTLCDPIDSSPPGSPVPGILQAGTLEWVAISFSNAWRWKVKVKSLSRVWLSATPWTVAYQAPSSMGFSRQEYWSWVPLPSPPKGLERTNGKAKHSTFCNPLLFSLI